MATFYVAKTGDNGDNGGEFDPWLTISYAATQATAGDIVNVKVGTYSERVTCQGTGTFGNEITIQTFEDDAVIVTLGFGITGDYYIISGFEIEPGDSGAGSGVDFQGDYNEVNDLYIHDDSWVGGGSTAIFFEGSYNTADDIVVYKQHSVYFADEVTDHHNTIKNSTMSFTSNQIGMLQGSYNTVDNCIMHDPGQIGRSGNAADGWNLRGDHQTFINSRLYNCFKFDAGQHIDGLQWWNPTADMLFENNIFGSYAIGGPLNTYDAGSDMMCEGVSERIIWRNNIFLGLINNTLMLKDDLTSEYPDWQIINNVFRASGSIRNCDVAPMDNWIVKNNTFHWNGPDWWSGDTWDIDYNIYASGYTMSAQDGIHTLDNTDPEYVDSSIGSGTDYGRNADWRPDAGSPMIDSGYSDSPVIATDIMGLSRVDDPSTTNTGGGTYAYYDIGAHEFQTSGPGIKTLAGGSDGVSTVSATLNATIGLGGQADGGSTAIATVIFAGVKLLAGTSDGSSTVGVAIKVTKGLVATSDGIATAVATVTGLEVLLAGSTAGSSTASAMLPWDSGSVGITEDTYLDENNPTSDKYQSELFLIKEYSSSIDLHGIVQIDFSSLNIPAGAIIREAELGYYYFAYSNDNPVGNTQTFSQVLRTDLVFSQTNWNEYKTSSNWTAGGCDSDGNDYTSEGQSSSTVLTAPVWQWWNDTAMVALVQDALDSRSSVLLGRIVDTDDTANATARYHSKDYTGDTTLRPVLRIWWTNIEEVLAGSSAGAAVVADIPAIVAIRGLLGESDGGSTASAVLTGGICLFTGTSDGGSTAGASLKCIKTLAGASDGTSTAGASLEETTDLSGASAGTSTVSGSFIDTTDLAAVSDGLSTVNGALSSIKKLAGTSEGLGLAYARVINVVVIGGQSNGSSTVAAFIYVPGIQELAGQAVGSSTARARLIEKIRLAGTTELFRTW